MKQLIENKFLEHLVRTFPRSPVQINHFLEGDAELLPLDNGTVLAITVDSIVEEIEQGLYKDPYLIGWMTVVANLSDIAAVGAEPMGILLLHSLPKDLSPGFLEKLQSGICEACRECGTFVLGGDTNAAPALQMGAAAIGLIRDEKIILRKGCQPGDRLYSTNHLGLGGAFALAELFLSGQPNPIVYRPLPRLVEGQIIRKYGSACIDTSDSLFPALANLMAINQVGFCLEKHWDQIVGDELRQLAQASGIPSWYFLAGPHGEFELLFTIPEQQESDFLSQAEAADWHPILLGETTNEPSCCYLQNGRSNTFDPATVANLFEQSEGQPERYFHKLKQIQYL